MYKEVYRIIDRETDYLQGAYSRAYHTEYDFDSVSSARGSNCHGIYKDRAKYKIAKYKVTYELIDEDCDKPTEKEIQRYLIKKEEEAKELIAKDKRLRELAIKEYQKTWENINDREKWVIDCIYSHQEFKKFFELDNINKIIGEIEFPKNKNEAISGLHEL